MEEQTGSTIEYVVVVEVVEVVVLLRKFQSGFLQVVFGMCIINRV